MAKLYNLARMTTATTGTGTITLGVAVAGYLTFANAGVQNGDVLFYGINDGSNSEVGWGTYTASGTTLTRNVIKSTSSNAAINLDGSAQVYVTALASDGGDLLPSFDHPMRGFDSAVNLQLNASVASNILTVAVKGNNGNDPSTSNPVLVPFRDATAANGDPAWVSITSALSINTNATGASLGTANGVPFRLWVVLFNNGGTPVLALWQSVTGGSAPSGIAPLNEGAVQSTTAMSGSATSAGVFYTPNGTALTSKAFRILGYLDFASGLTTAGTYASAPTAVQLLGPGVKKPGDIVQTQFAYATAASSVSSNTFGTGAPDTNAPVATVTLTSAPNLVHVVASGQIYLSNIAAIDVMAQIFRGPSGSVNTAVGPIMGINFGAASGALQTPCYNEALDAPGTTTAQLYSPRIKVGGSGTGRWGDVTFGTPGGSIRAHEIMV